MDQGYGIVGASAAVNPPPETPLDRVGVSADRVERIAEMVARFNARFYSDPGTGDNAKSVTAVPSGYIGQIHRLDNAVDALDKAVQRLCEIG